MNKNTFGGTSDHYQRELARTARILREMRLALAKHKKLIRKGVVVIEIPESLAKKYEF